MNDATLRSEAMARLDCPTLYQRLIDNFARVPSGRLVKSCVKYIVNMRLLVPHRGIYLTTEKYCMPVAKLVSSAKSLILNALSSVG